jgi:hypothetical protein
MQCGWREAAMNSIPSDEEFAAASRHMDWLSRNLDRVRKSVRYELRDSHPLHDFWIMSHKEGSFHAYVFYRKEADIAQCAADGRSKQLEALVHAELSRAGRGGLGETTVTFEYDSDENVHQKYNGNYFYRLR